MLPLAKLIRMLDVDRIANILGAHGSQPGAIKYALDGQRGLWLDSGTAYFSLTGEVVNVKEFGAIADGSSHPLSERYTSLSAAQVVYPFVTSLTDEIDYAALQSGANIAKSNSRPLFAPGGNYVINRSLDLTGAVRGWKVYGAGRNATSITGNLVEAYPILDFTGSQECRVSDLHVIGGAGGLQTCGILTARESFTDGLPTAGQGDSMFLENVQIEGTFSKVSFANVSADLMRVSKCAIYGNASKAVIISDTDSLGVGSKFKNFAAVTGNTLHNFTSSVIVGYTGSVMTWTGGAALYMDSTFFGVLGSATAALELNGAGGQALNLYQCRSEVNSSAANVTPILFTKASTSGFIFGLFDPKGTGTIVSIPAGSNITDYYIGVQTGVGGAKLIGGGGDLRNSFVKDAYNRGGDIGANGWNNIIVQTSADTTKWANFNNGWHNIIQGEQTIYLSGRMQHTGAYLGFYNHAQSAQQLLATGAGHTVDDVITALQNLGLVKQA